MDLGHTYRTDGGTRVCVYAPDGWLPPDELDMVTPQGEIRIASRIRENELECQPVLMQVGTGKKNVMSKCGNWECHRAVPGKCQCGRHPEGVVLWKAEV